MSDDEHRARDGLGVFAGPDGAVGGAIAEPSMVENEDDTDDSGAAELGNTSRGERSAFHDAWDVSLGVTAASDLELPHDVLQQFREIDQINQLASKKTSRHPQELRNGYTAHKRYFKDLIDPEDPMFGQLRAVEGAFLKASLQFDRIVKDPFDLVSYVELVTNPLLRSNYDTATTNVKRLVGQDITQEQILFYQDELSQDKLDRILKDGFEQSEANRGIPFAKSVDISKNDVLLLCRCLHNFGPTDTDLVQKFDDANLILPYCVIYLKASKNIEKPNMPPSDAASGTETSGSLRIFVIKDDQKAKGDQMEGLDDIVDSRDTRPFLPVEDANEDAAKEEANPHERDVTSVVDDVLVREISAWTDSGRNIGGTSISVTDLDPALGSSRRIPRIAPRLPKESSWEAVERVAREDVEVPPMKKSKLDEGDGATDVIDFLTNPRLSVTGGKDPKPERPSWLRLSSSPPFTAQARERLQDFQDRIISTMDRGFLSNWLRRVVTSLSRDRNASIVVLAQLVKDGRASEFEMQSVAESLRVQEDFNSPRYVGELESVASFIQLKNLLEELMKKDVNVLMLHGADKRLMLLWRVQMMLKELERDFVIYDSDMQERIWAMERMVAELEDQYNQHRTGDAPKKEEAKDDPNA